jgi:hypothetical protein
VFLLWVCVVGVGTFTCASWCKIPPPPSTMVGLVNLMEPTIDMPYVVNWAFTFWLAFFWTCDLKFIFEGWDPYGWIICVVGMLGCN